jgi:hypothetical protein
MLPRHRARPGAVILATCATLFLGSGLEAQPTPAPPPSDRQIVVTGQVRPPASDEDITSQARNISIVGDPLHNPLPRFEDRLCPGVLGLKPEAATYVIDRIRYNAQQLGLRMAPDDGTCEPNLIVAIVEGAQEQLAQLASNQGYMFAGLSVTRRGDLFEASGAARVWVNTLTRTRDGMPTQSARDAAGAPERRGTTFGGTDGAGNAITNTYSMPLPPVAATQAAQSRIFFPTREDIVSVLVLFDKEQVRGKTLLQLADYATMRGFASTRETKGDPAADTILSLFDGDGPKPGELTDFDHAYLGSLYSGIPNMPATSKLGNVNRILQHQQVEPDEEAQD